MASIVKTPSAVAFMRPTLAQELMDLEREWIGLENQYKKTPDMIREYYNRRKPILQKQIRAIREAMKGE